MRKCTLREMSPLIVLYMPEGCRYAALVKSPMTMVLRMASLLEQDTMGIPNRFNTLNSCSLNSVALEVDGN